MTRPIINTFAWLLFCLPIVSLQSGCASFMEMLGYGYTPPEIELKSIEVRNVSFGSIKLDVRLNVKNPNNFDLKVTKFDYSITALETLLAQGSIENFFSVPKNGQNEVKLPLTIDPEAAMRLINRILEKPKEDLPALVVANLEFDTPIGRMQKSFSQEKSLNKLSISK